MYLDIALAINLAAATGCALLAAKRGRDYNRLLDLVSEVNDFNAELLNDNIILKYKIKTLQTENNRLKQSGIKAGIIFQSCGSVDCDGNPGYCKECNQQLFQKRNTCK